MKNLFLFWEGKEFFLIKKLRELIYAHSKDYDIHFINYQNLKEYVDYIPKNFERLNIAFQTDFIRVNTICKHGGIWFDSDTLFMESPKKLYDLLEETNGFLIIEDNKRICNGIFGSKPNTELMKTWNEYNISVIERNPSMLWGQLGYIFLTTHFNEKRSLFEGYNIIDGIKTIYPVSWEYADSTYLRDTDYSVIQREFQPVIILVNSVYRAVEQNPNILNHSLLGKLIKMSEDNLL
jgi:hypothetical protein